MTTAMRPTYRIDYRDNDGMARTLNLKGYTYEDAKVAARKIVRETSEVVEITMVLPPFWYYPPAAVETVVWNSREYV